MVRRFPLPHFFLFYLEVNLSRGILASYSSIMKARSGPFSIGRAKPLRAEVPKEQPRHLQAQDTESVLEGHLGDIFNIEALRYQ